MQDYHLSLVPGMLRELRPDLRIGHFSHTPWAPVDYFRMLPDDIGEQLLRGHPGRRPRRVPDPPLGGRVHRLLHARSSAAPAAPGSGCTGWAPTRTSCAAARREADVDERMADRCGSRCGADRRTIVRVDRTELSKNIVRGLHAYRQLLDERPEWRERVVHVAFAYPSRQDLAVYRDYTAEVQRVADAINAEYGTEDWTPVLLHVDDDFARSLAAYRLADVALVNPIRDGMNLVAKEVPVVSDEGCALVLSREAGAYEELGEDAIMVNPYDVSATADGAARGADDGPADERAARTKRLAAAATALPPPQWFLDQLRTRLRPADADRPD